MLPEDDQPQVHEIGNRTYIVADVDPLDVDGIRTLQVGTALWGLAFLMLLPFYGRLSDDGHLWWMWTCVAGFGLGLLGWDYCRRRSRARRARQAEAGQHHDDQHHDDQHPEDPHAGGPHSEDRGTGA